MKHLFLALLILVIPAKSFSQVYGCNNAGVGDTFQIDYVDSGYGFGRGYFTYDFSAISWVGANNFVALRVGPTMFTYYSYSGGIYSLTIAITPTAFIKPIKGLEQICPGGAFTVHDAVPGGMWHSSNPTVEAMAFSGLITTLSGGNSVISYAVSGYTCTSLSHVDYPPAPISGPSTVCAGDTIYLLSYTFNGGDVYLGGIYSSSDTSIAQNVSVIIPEEPGYIKGISAGVTTITYTDIFAATCYSTKTITVTSGITIPVISGCSCLCAGGSLTLSDSTTGGIWSISNTTVATIDPYTGKLTGISGGADTVYYTVTSGSCVPAVRSIPVVVTSFAPILGPLTGSTSLCNGATINLSDTSTGGTWSSSNTLIATVDSLAGVVLSISPGTLLISYTLSNVCGSSSSVMTITVNPLPVPVSGADSVCESSSTLLSDAGGGTWSSGNTIIATIGSTGRVTGVLSTGVSDTIIYTLPSGCSITTTIMVLPLPEPIAGYDSICAGSSMTLSDTTAGGTWSSGATAIATIGSTSGIVNGVSAGDVAITYTVSTGCSVVRTISVNPLPSVITGLTHVCPTDTTTLIDAGGGTWYCDHSFIASVDTVTGIVTGVSAGTATVSYTLSTGCYITTVFTTDSLHIPTVSIVDTGDTLCAGSYVAFGASSVNEGSKPHYQWKVNGINAGTDTNYYYYIPVDSDIVGVTLTSNAACALPDTTSKAVMVNVITVPLPAIAIAASPGIAIAKGQIDTLTATVIGGGLAPVYQWLINGLPVVGATSAIFICDTFGNNDSVTCIAANSGTCIYSTFNSVIINVSALGTKSLWDKRHYIVFPNPTQDELTITGVQQNTNYRLLTITGITVQKGAFHKDINTISLQKCPRGVYILEMTGEDGERNIERVVKD